MTGGIQESQVWNIIYSVKQFNNISELKLFTEELSLSGGRELILLLEDSGEREGERDYNLYTGNSHRLQQKIFPYLYSTKSFTKLKENIRILQSLVNFILMF